ncbi:S-type pyocin domain-containing protein [Xenorhabdus khoisanae]|uniref:S-type pyocin domain-containing protein n=1 Tax=Xenorhabdus khoisanae TaxID=880157 RepID=UPI00235824B4|nr:S-type pyocin domain-containing protein [Xenorhabdus khoisanae]MDC9612536.1 S-type pyocin domain-containing protein [Xenorhabdus khoisanae]
MSDAGRLDCVPCNKFKYWLEFQLLDNQGKPLAGIPYNLKSRDGVINANGVTDGQGILREENLSPLPMTLHVGAQKLAEQLTEKSAADAVKTEKASGSLPAIMPGELSDGLPKIEGWTEATLQEKYYADAEYPGITVLPEHNCRHVIAVERIVKPVFAKSCLQPAGCTDAGTGMEPHTHFGEMQIYRAQPTLGGNPNRQETSEPFIFKAIAWVGNQIFPRAEANPMIFNEVMRQQMMQQMAANAAAAQANNGDIDKDSPLLSQSEQQKLRNIQFELSRDAYLVETSVAVLGAMMRSWWDGGDSDLVNHKNLAKIADEKGTTPTRVRYRFVEDVKTGQSIPVGYHTSEGSALEHVKVRHVQYNSSFKQYEFWEDDADSPTLVWYVDPQKGEISQSEINSHYGQHDTSINVKVIPLDSTSTSQTPGLPIPEQTTWRDGILVNPQQDPNDIAGNKTETPIPNSADQGPSKTTTPVQESDFRDYILIFPISNIPAIYVYLSQKADKDEEYYKKKIQEFESTLATEDVHGLRRHGPGTTLEQQNYRAKTGYTPDGRNGKPTDSTRFLSYKDQYEAIQKALPLYNPEIHKTGRVDFDMGKVVSEGYKKGGKEYFETSTVRAGFDKKTGKIYSIFGIE